MENLLYQTGTVSRIYEIARNFVVSSSETCRTINSGKFPFFEKCHTERLSPDSFILGKFEDGGHHSGGPLPHSEQS